MVTGKYTTTMRATATNTLLRKKLRNVKILRATIYPQEYDADFPVRKN